MGEEDSRSSSCPSFEFRPSSPCSTEKSSALPQSEEQQERQPPTTHRHRAGIPLRPTIGHLRPQPLRSRSLVSWRDRRKLSTSSHCPLPKPTGLQKKISEAVLMGTDPHMPGDGEDRVGVSRVQDCSPGVTTVPMEVQPAAIPRLLLFLYHSPTLPELHSGDYSRNPEPYSLTSRGQDFQTAVGSPGSASTVSQIDPGISQLFPSAPAKVAIPARDPYSGTAFSGKLKVVLCNHKLWLTFHRHQNEMIITKSGRSFFVNVSLGDGEILNSFSFLEEGLLDQSFIDQSPNYLTQVNLFYQDNKILITKILLPGERWFGESLMFPSLVYQIQGMDPISYYRVSVEVVLVDPYRWRYQKKQWVQYEMEENNVPGNQMYIHPDSPNTGVHWMGQEISFRKGLRLTNTKETSKNQIYLKSCHKYQPKLHIEELRDGEDGTLSPSVSHVITFPETEFFAVTAYQNNEIIQLKIKHNCFASSFRKRFLLEEK